MKKSYIVLAFSLIISNVEAQECTLQLNNQSKHNIYVLEDKQILSPIISPGSVKNIQYNCFNVPLVLMENEKNNRKYVIPYKLKIDKSIQNSSITGNNLIIHFPENFTRSTESCSHCEFGEGENQYCPYPKGGYQNLHGPSGPTCTCC